MKTSPDIEKINNLIELFEKIDALVHSYTFFEKNKPKNAINPYEKIIELQKETALLIGELDEIIDTYGNRYTKHGDKGRVDMFREATTIRDSWGSAILKDVISELRIIKGKISKSKMTNNQLKNHKDNNRKVFVVHGHNKDVTLGVQLLLGQLELEPIIIANEANKGRTIIEKIENYSEVAFAIVLMTDDDMGKRKNDNNLMPRARQNVILELGYFIGKLGREKVCALYTNGVEMPSDFHGILYIPIDKTGTWKYLLVKELREAGFNVDANKIT